jgi:nucleoside-triphosphatase THEP1
MKAALLGSLWAALEIVLGSFLHSLGVAFAGSILASLGVCLMAATTVLWNQRGLLWRAGAICALMKSISPSAVIVGPMIGIMLEALLLEGTTRLAGRNTLGLVTGGALATMTPVLQLIAGVLLTYGTNSARAYVALYELAARSVHLESLGPLDLLLLWLLVNLSLGSLAALIGIRAGKRAILLPDPVLSRDRRESPFSLAKADSSQRFSLPLLALHLLALPLGLAAVSFLSIPVAALVIGSYFAFCLASYSPVRRRFRRPRLWIEFAGISVLAGALLGGLTSQGGAGGVTIGLQMVLRATLVVVAFSAISVELRNPRVIGWLLQRRMGRYSAALDVAFEALPVMSRAIGEEKRFFREPLTSIAHVLVTARAYLKVSEEQTRPPVIILTGEQGSGKTSFIMSLAKRLSQEAFPMSGISAPVVLLDGARQGYDILDLATGERAPLCRITGVASGEQVGPFRFLPAGLALGTAALDASRDQAGGVVIVDEIGPLELSGSGWSGAVTRLLDGMAASVILVVRPALLENVSRQWNFTPHAVWNPASTSLEHAIRELRLMR